MTKTKFSLGDTLKPEAIVSIKEIHVSEEGTTYDVVILLNCRPPVIHVETLSEEQLENFELLKKKDD